MQGDDTFHLHQDVVRFFRRDPAIRLCLRHDALQRLDFGGCQLIPAAQFTKASRRIGVTLDAVSVASRVVFIASMLQPAIQTVAPTSP
jgi:hypothetical protein